MNAMRKLASRETRQSAKKVSLLHRVNHTLKSKVNDCLEQTKPSESEPNLKIILFQNFCLDNAQRPFTFSCQIP